MKNGYLPRYPFFNFGVDVGAVADGKNFYYCALDFENYPVVAYPEFFVFFVE